MEESKGSMLLGLISQTAAMYINRKCVYAYPILVIAQAFPPIRVSICNTVLP